MTGKQNSKHMESQTNLYNKLGKNHFNFENLKLKIAINLESKASLNTESSESTKIILKKSNVSIELQCAYYSC